jgi:hypothetical protein
MTVTTNKPRQVNVRRISDKLVQLHARSAKLQTSKSPRRSTLIVGGDVVPELHRSVEMGAARKTIHRFVLTSHPK